MKTILVICEGETEQEFCRSILGPHFGAKGIGIQFPLIKKTSGGIGKWESLKHHVTTHLKQNRQAFVTTLIDYYGMYANLQYPKWEEAHLIPDKSNRLTVLELAMKEDLEPSLQPRFLPYIQLHEFEGLLFTTITAFRDNFTSMEANFAELENIIHTYPNPEDINTGTETAPSKRLNKLINGYDKVVYGPLLIEAIGLKNIRSKCPRFNQWITSMELLYED